MDRDAQFHYINDQATAFLAAGEPVISVDTKKKELVGNFKNHGREYRPKATPEAVNVHDFIDPALGRAVPYGVYDIADNKGWVSVGTDHDTASFAVHAIQRWWHTLGQTRYPKASRLMITADGGGSNGHRVRLWKVELQTLANALGIPITVCHLPPGTSKWNKIEHRLFSFITLNWRGKPLRSFKTIVQLIAATTTATGLTVRAELDKNKYPKGVKTSDAQLAGDQTSPATPSTVTGIMRSRRTPMQQDGHHKTTELFRNRPSKGLVRASRQRGAAVRCERNQKNHIGVSHERANRPTAGQVPQPKGLVRASRQRGAAVR